MLPLMALMIAVYGSGRLINDGLARSDGDGATIATWLVSVGAIVLLWLLAFSVLASGASIDL